MAITVLSQGESGASGSEASVVINANGADKIIAIVTLEYFQASRTIGDVQFNLDDLTFVAGSQILQGNIRDSGIYFLDNPDQLSASVVAKVVGGSCRIHLTAIAISSGQGGPPDITLNSGNNNIPSVTVNGIADGALLFAGGGITAGATIGFVSGQTEIGQSNIVGALTGWGEYFFEDGASKFLQNTASASNNWVKLCAVINELQAPLPSTLAHDTFTDVNGTDLENHTPDIGAGWINREPAIIYEIQSNELEYVGGERFSDGYHFDLVPPDEYEVEVDEKYDTASTNNYLVAIVRADPVAMDTYYNASIRYDASKNVYLQRVVGGSTTTLLNVQRAGSQLQANTWYKVRFYTKTDGSGNIVLKLFLDDTLVAEVTDSDAAKLTGVGRGGIRHGIQDPPAGIVVNWDNFRIRANVILQQVSVSGASANSGAVLTQIKHFLSLSGLSTNFGGLLTATPGFVQQQVEGVSANSGALATQAFTFIQQVVSGISANSGALATFARYFVSLAGQSVNAGNLIVFKFLESRLIRKIKTTFFIDIDDEGT